MQPIFFAIAGHALEKFLAFFRRLDADAGDLNLSFEIALLVDQGRHPGPAPRSPAAAVEKLPWTAAERIPRETRPLPIDVRERYASADWLAPAIVSYPH